MRWKSTVTKNIDPSNEQCNEHRVVVKELNYFLLQLYFLLKISTTSHFPLFPPFPLPCPGR